MNLSLFTLANAVFERVALLFVSFSSDIIVFYFGLLLELNDMTRVTATFLTKKRVFWRALIRIYARFFSLHAAPDNEHHPHPHQQQPHNLAGRAYEVKFLNQLLTLLSHFLQSLTTMLKADPQHQIHALEEIVFAIELFGIVVHANV